MAAVNEGKILVVADVAELPHKPAPTRSPAGDHPITATLKVRVEALQGPNARRPTSSTELLSARGLGPESRYHRVRAGLVTVAAGVRLLPFAPLDWVDIVDAAPIRVGLILEQPGLAR
jgi:hypothetical protein